MQKATELGRRCGAMALALTSVTAAVYLPLFRMYRASVPQSFHAGSYDVFQRFLVNGFGPAIIILLLSLLLSAVDGMRRAQPVNTTATIPQREIVVAIGFACIPLIGLLGSRLSHGPFMDRYFLSSIAGYAIILGFESFPPASPLLDGKGVSRMHVPAYGLGCRNDRLFWPEAQDQAC